MLIWPTCFTFKHKGLQRFIERNADPDAARVYITFTATFSDPASKPQEATRSSEHHEGAAAREERGGEWIRAGVQRHSEKGLWPVPVLEQPLLAPATQTPPPEGQYYRRHQHQGFNDELVALLLQISKDEESVYKSNKGGYQSQPDLFERAEPALVKLRDAVYDRVAAYMRTSPAGLGGLGADDDVPNGVVEIEIYNAWFGLNKPGDSNSPHVHPAASVSGVYYVACPEVVGATATKSTADTVEREAGGTLSPASGLLEEGKLHLLDPRGYGWASVGRRSSGSGMDGASDGDDANVDHAGASACAGVERTTPAGRLEQVITPEPGKLVLFPGYVEHWVEPYRSVQPVANRNGNAGTDGRAGMRVPRIAIAFNVRVKQMPEVELKTRGVQVYVPLRHAHRKPSTTQDEGMVGGASNGNCNAAHGICT